ncbi:hypothetical protein GDO86_011968 [Hymenochirus boettgeri]|uniref:Solute carrier family 66 member 3 n=1 Tax=Hymenochirus boettgeri TaxID=247094 RepID=A0A8T2JDW5_9PIPI|nr:hypothetical protein GDO86_011968 [Hymenochirus boettgeri]
MVSELEILIFANWSTLVACMVLKFPQILSVMAAKSAEGVSLQSVLLELSGFLLFLRYQMYYNYPLETYLEYPMLMIQDAVLLMLLFHYTGSIKNALPYAAIFFAAWNILALHRWIIDMAMYLCTAISASSKFVQLQYLWQTQDSGQASALTWALATYTSAGKILNPSHDIFD